MKPKFLKHMNPKSIILLLIVFLTGYRDSTAQTDKIPNLSRSPQYTFATTLAEQEEQLRTNPIMLRFAESRKKQANDPHRPVYHLVSPESFMNDPHLSYWKGSWHLFYQGRPMEEKQRSHWAHAVSEDLVHWRDLPYALYPGPEEACFSGNVLAEADRAIAFYHGRNFGNITAISSDPLLLNWEKKYKEGYISVKIGQSVDKAFAGTKGEAGLTNISAKETATETKHTIPEGSYIFDPCIWKKGEYYYSLSGCSVPKGPGGKRVPTELLFRSKDLVNWEYLHEFSEGDRFSYIGDTRHCPNFVPIGNKFMLSYFGSASGGQYLLGDYDKERDKFVVTSHGRINYGSIHPGGIHAPTIQSDGKGGVIMICNINAGMVTGEWDHLMTLPRRMTLAAGDNVLIEPVEAVESLRYDGKHLGKMTLPANQEIVLEGVKGKAIEIVAEIDLTAGRKKADFQDQALPPFTYKDPASTPMFEMNVLRSPDKKEYTRIAFYPARAAKGGTDRKENSWITLDSSYSSTLPGAFSRAPETAPVMLKEGESLQLRVFIDHSVVEVFVNGRQCITSRVYPGLKESEGVSVRSAGKDAALNSLSAYQMKSIY